MYQCESVSVCSKLSPSVLATLYFECIMCVKCIQKCEYAIFHSHTRNLKLDGHFTPSTKAIFMR